MVFLCGSILEENFFKSCEKLASIALFWILHFLDQGETLYYATYLHKVYSKICNVFVLDISRLLEHFQ